MQPGSSSYVSPMDSFAPNDASSSRSLPTASTSRGYTQDHYRSSSLRRKRKVDRACDACRRRKTKCDGPKMPDNICSKCAQNRKTCTYLEASKPRGPPKAYITALEDKMEALEGLLKRLRPDQDFSEELGPPIVRDSWRSEDAANAGSQSNSSYAYQPSNGASNAYDGLRAANDSNDSDSESDSVSNNPYSSDSDGLVDKFTTGMARLTLRGPDAPAKEDENHIRFHGKSSSMNLIDVTRKFKQLHIQQTLDREGSNSLNSQQSSNPPSFNPGVTRRPEYWRFPKWEFVWEGLHIRSPEFLTDVLAKFPPPELATNLFDLYFHHINILFPLIHRPTFERQWKSQLHERNIWFACLTMSIFALASRWCQDVRVLPENQQAKPAETIDWTLAGWNYFSVCVSIHRMRRSLFFPASLFEIQTFSTLSLFLRGTSTQTTAWLFITMGMRKAQDAGAHRKTIYNRTPTVDDELWKRAFWMLVGLDRVTSAALGRPCSIDEENFDLDPPLDVDDEYWENDDPSLAFQQPAGKPSGVTSFILWLSLTDIIALALQTIYCVRPTGGLMEHMKPPTSEDLVKQLDKSLMAWIDKIPERLKWARDMQDHVSSNQSAMLYNTYHFTQILVHRPFIRPLRFNSPDGNIVSPSPALALCCSAAKSCVRIIERQMRVGYSSVIELVHTAQVAAAILIVEIWHLKAKERMHKVMNKEEDVKPKYVQSVQELLDDIAILMKALQWAKPRYGHVPLVIAKIQEALPNSTDDIEVDIPMYIIHDLAEAPSGTSLATATANESEFAVSPMESHPSSSSRHPSHWTSTEPITNDPSPSNSYVAPYMPQTTLPQTRTYSPSASSMYQQQNNVERSIPTIEPVHLQSMPLWQYAPDLTQLHSIPDRTAAAHTYHDSARRQPYVIPPLATYHGRADEYVHQPNSTPRTGHSIMMASRGGYHPVSDTRSIPSPSYHPFAIKDPAYKPHLGCEPWNHQYSGPTSYPYYSLHPEHHDAPQVPHSHPHPRLPHTAYFSYPYGP